MATAYRGREDEQRALDAYVKLMRASDSVTRRIHRHLLGEALTVSQFGVLEALRFRGTLCQGELGQKILKSGGNVTLVVGHLERRGLVRRERDPADRRRVAVHLTDEGRALVDRLFPGHVSGIVAEFAHLAPDEQEELGRLCRKLGRGQ